MPIHLPLHYRPLGISLLFTFLVSLAHAGVHRAVPVGEEDNPFGYYEYLPDLYLENSEATMPVVIFFHGLGEGGNGSTQLNRVLQNGPPRIIQVSTHPLNQLFNDNDMIVLSPQVASGTWWNANHVRAFLSYALETYRIDTRRIYLTGLSAGSAGVQAFLRNDLFADDVTAVTVCAVRGGVDNEQGRSMGYRVPYWGLSAWGDASGDMINGANNMASGAAEFANWNEPELILANYPGTDTVRTATFSPDGEWIWDNGIVGNDQTGNIKITIVPGSSHNTWTMAYDSVEMWNWLFSQVKPVVEIQSPFSGKVYSQDELIQLTATGYDVYEADLSANSYLWLNNFGYEIARGQNTATDELSVGVHLLRVLGVDDQFRAGAMTVPITIAYGNPMYARIDFGSQNYQTPDNWNNVTNSSSGVLNNLVSHDGVNTGIRLAIVTPFAGGNWGGVVSSGPYPESAQRDSFFLNATVPNAQLELSGLNPLRSYDITFFGSRADNRDMTTVLSAGSKEASLNASQNVHQVAVLENVRPDGFGKILIDVRRGDTALFAFLGVLTIESTGEPTAIQSFEYFLDYHMPVSSNIPREAMDDPDRDGVVNLQEFAFGGNPMDGVSRELMPRVYQNGSLHVDFTYYQLKEPLGVLYQAYYSHDLISWFPVSDSEYFTMDEMSVDGAAGLLKKTISVDREQMPQSSLFFKVGVELEEN